MDYGFKVSLQDCLLNGPGRISLTQFLEGDGSFPIRVHCLFGKEYPVNSM